METPATKASKLFKNEYVIALSAISLGLTGHADYKRTGAPTVRNAVPAAWWGVSRGALLATYGWTWRTLRCLIYLNVAEAAILFATNTSRYDYTPGTAPPPSAKPLSAAQ